MFNSSLFYGISLLSRDSVQKEPGAIVGPIANIFGFILNAIFNFVNGITSTEANLLGISIVLLTIVARVVMLPLAIKSQKSMAAMQKLQPEVEKLKAKYGDSKDPEDQRRMQIELNNLYKENKANPFGGCLPLFVQFPIFMALYYIMNQSYRFIDRLGSLYEQISHEIMEIPQYYNYIYDIGFSKVPSGMALDLSVTEDLTNLIGKFKPEDWSLLFEQIPQEFVAGLTPLLETKYSIEQFFTINLTENTSLAWPVILIPILAVITSFLTSFISSRQTKSTDPSAKMQQRMMMIMMPVFMGFITLGMPAGVGIYWITSSVFQVVQQLVLHKAFDKNKTDSEVAPAKQSNSTAKKK